MDIKLYVLDPFLFWKYKPSQDHQQKELLLTWNSETTQIINIYRHNITTKQKSSYKAWKKNYSMQLFKIFSTENTSKQQTWWLLWGIAWIDFEVVLANFCCFEYDGAHAPEEVQKISARTLLEFCQLTKTANFIATPMKKHI